MTWRIASLPMYDADPGAVQAWWGGIARALRAQGLEGVPPLLEWPSELHAHWRKPQLLLSQTCGYPLVTTLRGAVRVVGAIRYTAPGCAGIRYRSELIARHDDGGGIENFRGRVAAVNSFDSHSGAHALRARVAPLAVRGAFFSGWRVSGSHRGSLEAVRSKSADIAAIDCVTLAGLRRQAPELLAGLRRIGSTVAAPGLPLITAASTSDAELHALRRAMLSACHDQALAAARDALFIDSFEVVEASAWRAIEEIRRSAMGVSWPGPQPALDPA